MTGQVELRAWRPEDENAWQSIVWQPAVEEYLGESEALPPIGELLVHHDGFTYCRAAVWLDDRIIGLVTLGGTAPEPAEIQVAIHPDYHGKGYGTQAAEAVALLAWAEVPDLTITGLVRADNAASRRLTVAMGLELVVDPDDGDYLRIVPLSRFDAIKARLSHLLLHAVTEDEIKAWIDHAYQLLGKEPA